MMGKKINNNMCEKIEKIIIFENHNIGKLQMKKILLLVAVFFAFNFTYAQTAEEALKACAEAMKYERLDSFKTMITKAKLYQGDARVSFILTEKQVVNGEDKKNFFRFEQSLRQSGNVDERTWIVSWDDDDFEGGEFFQIKPNYKEENIENAGELFSFYDMIVPTLRSLLNIPDSVKDKLILKVEGTEKFNNADCQKISVSSKDSTGEVKLGQYIYIDVASNWFKGTATPTEKGLRELLLDNFAKTKGWIYPKSIIIKLDGKKQLEMELDKIEAEIEIDNSLFARP